jgi:hypothetical protein
VFPYASNTSRSMEIDHTILYSEGGPSHHRQLRPHDPQPPPDQDPRQLGRPTTLARDLPLARSYGTLYLVDHTGTRQLPNAA